jgi:hypothetical protein
LSGISGGVEVDPKWTANITNYFTKAQWNVTNESYLTNYNTSVMHIWDWNATNTTYRTLINGTFVGSWNVTGALNSENLKVASCDVKADVTNGTLYCGTDAIGAAGGVTGLGTAGYIPMWNGTGSINNSNIYQDDNHIGINTTSAFRTLTLIGDVLFNLTTKVGDSFRIINSSNNTQFDVNAITGDIIIGDLNAASCDVKAYTNGTLYCGTDATGAAGGIVEWINRSTNNTHEVSGTTLSMIEALNTTLSANSNYTFKCMLTFSTNISTTGISIAMNFSSNPFNDSYRVSIPMAAAGTDSIWEANVVGNAKIVTSTGVVTANENYTAKIEGTVMVGTSAIVARPAFAAEVATNRSRVFGGRNGLSYCRWTTI